MHDNGGFTLIEVLVTLVLISIGALAIMRHVSQVQEMEADIGHIESMAHLASMKMFDLEQDGLSPSLSRQGDFASQSGFSWVAKSSPLSMDGWYVVRLVVRRDDTGRTVIVERLFQGAP